MKWNPQFDGGAPQGFIVQYRKKENEIWKTIYIQSNETKEFVHIWNPQPKTKYFLRMLAFNRIGNSSFTEQFTILTDGKLCFFNLFKSFCGDKQFKGLFSRYIMKNKQLHMLKCVISIVSSNIET